MGTSGSESITYWRPWTGLPSMNISAMVSLLRPKQWVKNGFVCTGVLFGARWQQPKTVEAMALAFVAFCLMSSCVYVINDYIDREADRKHPTKRNRPLASKSVTTTQAATAAFICASASLITAWLADTGVLLIILSYLAINSAYSLGLKYQAVIDVFCIAIGFMLRIIAGTWGIRIPPSGWLLLTGMFLTLFLGFAKRRAEWTEAIGDHARRQVLGFYSQELLDTFLSITTTGTVLSYGLYTLDAKTIELHRTDKLIYTLPLVLFGLFRYLFLLHSRNTGENPSAQVFTDPQILLSGFTFAAITFFLVS
jgi:4-hydroxybenzoate polyprenyltransferase